MKIKSLKWKLLLIIILVSTIPLAIMGVMSYNISKNSMIEAKEAHLKGLVDGAYLLAETLHKDVERGNLTLEEAQEELRLALVGPKQENGTRQIRLDSPHIGQGDYFFAYNKDIVAVMHPQPFEGEVRNSPNVDGILVNQEIYNQKEGYYAFNWQNPDEASPRPKIAYLRYFEPWDWVIVNGSYYDNFYRESEQLGVMSLIIVGVSIIFIIIASLLFSNQVVRQVSKVKNIIEKMGQGDFSQRVEVRSQDEIGQMSLSLNQALDQVTSVINEVKESSEHMKYSVQQMSESANQLNSASTEIASSIEEVSTGSEKQTDSLQNVSSYMEELAASFDETSQNVGIVTTMANNAQDVSEGGRDKALATIEQMDKIQDSVLQIKDVIQHLTTNIDEIGNFVTVITDISEQTNLLALNAAIEAARAGDSGRGFAVVADEVRKLAEQSTKSASEIEKLIGKITEESRRSNQVVNESSKYVEAGTQSVKDSSQSFEQILEFVSKVSVEVDKVNRAIQEVNDGAQETANSLSSLGGLNEETNLHTQSVASSVEEQTAMIEEMNASMQELLRRTEKLDGLIGRFNV